MKDYTALHIIRDSNVSDDIKPILTRAFDKMCAAQDPNGCVSTSAAVYCALFSMGYSPIIRMGQVEIDGEPFYHAWIELDGKVIDIAIYGNTHFSPLTRGLSQIMPQIYRDYGDTDIIYLPDKFDDDFRWSGVSGGYQKDIVYYMDHAPKKNALWDVSLYCLNQSPTAQNRQKLRGAIKNYKIGDI